MEKLWTFFLGLGDNMWQDKWSPKATMPSQCDGGGRYRETLSTDREVWRRVVDALPSMGINAVLIDIGEGVRYDTHPELAKNGSWTKDELKAELDHMRSIGLEPLPKLNFSACHDAWLGEYAYMLSTQKYYEVASDLIGEVCELFDSPRLFHLGMDEEDYADHHTGMTSIRSDALWWHDLYFYFRETEKHGARPWIWSDYFWKHQAGWEQKMPKSCLQSNWFYENIQPKKADGRYPQVGYQTYLELARMGYDQLPAMTDWNCRQNINQTVWFTLTEGIADEHMLGYMAAPWLPTTDLNFYSLLNNAQRLKYARAMFEEYTPEGRAEMCARKSPKTTFHF